MPDLRREVDRLFEDFFSLSPGSIGGSQAMQEFTPRLEVVENEKGYVLRAELPGMKPEDIQLSVDDNILTISGERRREAQRTERGFEYSEVSYGRFTRAITLPPGTDGSKIEADVKHGMLEVQIPRSESTRPRRIAVGGQRGTQQSAPQVSQGASGERGASSERDASSERAKGQSTETPGAQGAQGQPRRT